MDSLFLRDNYFQAMAKNAKVRIVKDALDTLIEERVVNRKPEDARRMENYRRFLKMQADTVILECEYQKEI